MKVELIPVIEISNTDQSIKWPDSGPFWEYADEWENYNRLSNISAGFSDQLISYAKGSSLYRIDEISNADLAKAIQKELTIQQTEENKGIEDLVCPFSGGYILRVDNRDIYFPQCCADLADIEQWLNLINGETEYFSAGHPSPRITENGDKLHFDFINTDTGENFAPPVIVETLEIDKSELGNAVKNTKKELDFLGNRLQSINRTESLNIPDIAERLIFGKSED